MKGWAVALTLFVVIPLVIAWEGFAIMLLWRWFLVPLGAPEVSLAAAIGIALIVARLTNHGESVTHQQRDGAALRLACFWVTAPAFSIAAGWIVKGFL